MIYTANFVGHYPVGTAAVIVAKDRNQALSLLKKELKKQGLPTHDIEISQINSKKPQAIILCNGDY